ncbi:MAG: hypothetical protein HY903_14880 [Deltaproteobacteria bacterium]|nr:hypothetical protein [Deltaproteobacteria bacterium]
MRGGSILWVAAALTSFGCSHTSPGTHVEIVDKDGAISYVSGAAGIGTNQSLACGQAVSRAVAAVALKFADKNDDIAEDVAKEVGAEDGRVFMQRYAKATAMDAAVQDVQFDPVEHVCVASIRWTPPVFVKEAIRKYAEAIKRDELGEPAAPKAAPAPAASASPGPAPTAAPAAAPAPAAPPPDPCKSQRAQATKTQRTLQKANDDFSECTRRTSGDERMCSRYKAYVDEAGAKEASARKTLDDCAAIHP